MPRRPSNFTYADVRRAVKAVRDAGLDVNTVEVTNEGTIRVMRTATDVDETVQPDGNDWDEVLQ